MTLPRMLLLALLVTAATMGVAAVVSLRGEPDRRPPAAASSPPDATEPRPEARASAVLRAWDVRRARAWAGGEPRLLAPLYTRGSAAGRQDRSMLGAWQARGLRVQGMRMQLLAVRVRHASAYRLVLVVTDRLAAATAVGPGVRVRLPDDAASTRVVTLRWVSGSWRVGAVRDQPRPLWSTARTLRSRNS